mmetsp:Transcript_24360/g.64289  ORF Transcript_24360/g.64289 Transcript_24360/m.64289 type:complete len:99 (+) Transcript_24360:99-395(+)
MRTAWPDIPQHAAPLGGMECCGMSGGVVRKPTIEDGFCLRTARNEREKRKGQEERGGRKVKGGDLERVIGIVWRRGTKEVGVGFLPLWILFFKKTVVY